jgi:hypothetical protein
VAERRLKVLAGLTAVLSYDQAFADATNAAVVEPWAEAHLILIRRAVARGEVPAEVNVEVNVELLSQVVARLAAYRALVEHKAFDLDFLTEMVDHVLLPALHVDTSAEAATSRH